MNGLLILVIGVGIVLTLFDPAVGAVFAGLGIVALAAASLGPAIRNGWKWFLIVGGKPTERLTHIEKRLVIVGTGMVASVFATILTQMAFGP